MNQEKIRATSLPSLRELPRLPPSQILIISTLLWGNLIWGHRVCRLQVCCSSDPLPSTRSNQLQPGYTSGYLSSSTTPYWPSIPIYKPMEAIPIKTTIWSFFFPVIFAKNGDKPSPEYLTLPLSGKYWFLKSFNGYRSLRAVFWPHFSQIFLIQKTE